MIRHLFISPGHNYFGHHAQPAGDNPLIEVSTIECVAGLGIRGDRFFNYKPDYKGQITFFSMEVFEQMQIELGIPHADASKTRRNVFTKGADLNDWIGKKFEIQGVLFEGMEECKPCHWMDHAFAPGAEQWLKGRGGLRARILTDGNLSSALHPPPFTAGLLTGGKSSRMGRDKAGVEFLGTPLWQHQLQTLRNLGAREILISGQKAACYGDSGLTIVEDEIKEVGPLAGVAALLGAGKHPLVLVLAVDMPYITETYLRAFLSQCTPETGVVPEVNGFLVGVAAIYPKSAIAVATQVLKGENHSIQHFVSECAARHLLKILNSPLDLPNTTL